MAPFRWPLLRQDVMLATEVVARRPIKPSDWETIAQVLTNEFKTEDKPVQLTGRACRERIDRIMQKYKEDDKRALKK